MKNLIKTYCLFTMVSLLVVLSSSSKREFIPFGHPEIDRIRKEIKSIPTNPENFLERKNTLALWTKFMMFSGANLNALDPEEHKGHLIFFCIGS